MIFDCSHSAFIRGDHFPVSVSTFVILCASCYKMHNFIHSMFPGHVGIENLLIFFAKGKSMELYFLKIKTRSKIRFFYSMWEQGQYSSMDSRERKVFFAILLICQSWDEYCTIVVTPGQSTSLQSQKRRRMLIAKNIMIKYISVIERIMIRLSYRFFKIWNFIEFSF